MKLRYLQSNDWEANSKGLNDFPKGIKKVLGEEVVQFYAELDNADRKLYKKKFLSKGEEKQQNLLTELVTLITSPEEKVYVQNELEKLDERQKKLVEEQDKMFVALFEYLKTKHKPNSDTVSEVIQNSDSMANQPSEDGTINLTGDKHSDAPSESDC